MVYMKGLILDRIFRNEMAKYEIADALFQKPDLKYHTENLKTRGQTV